MGIRHGKQAHMASAVEELEGHHGVEITKQTTLLIDDDVKNVQTALRDGVRAVWLNPRHSHVVLQEIFELV
jgi:FMN phosphatase YigB (HAD superfamily)